METRELKAEYMETKNSMRAAKSFEEFLTYHKQWINGEIIERIKR